MKNYQLDPMWYYTSPGLAYDAELKMTGVKLELLSDSDMLLMFDKATRGGVAIITRRHDKANNPYMSDYNKMQATKYLTYLDANNLYGYAMSQPLPTGKFEWIEPQEIEKILNHEDDHKIGYMIECDLEYPKELHNKHNDYPLAPEIMVINKVPKLIPSLNNRTKYVLHYKNLKQNLLLGMKLTKVHRIIGFEQSPCLKQYIDLNTNLRTKANNDSEKDFFKLMNNSLFGKTMENIRKRVNVKLVTSGKQALKLVVKPNYDRRVIFSENLTAMHMKKTKLIFNKPVYLGSCILDLSKTLMYDFHYNFMKKKYGDNAKLLFTDTDSLAYEIQTEDFYKDITPYVQDKFDTSNFPAEHSSGIPTGVNKKIVGMLKDECGGKIMTEFVGLRTKMYAFKVGEEVTKRAKGVKKNVIKNGINFNEYKQCLDTQEEVYKSMNIIRRKLHNIFTEEFNKIALSAKDDKRYILQDGISTLSYGHYKINE